MKIIIFFLSFILLGIRIQAATFYFSPVFPAGPGNINFSTSANADGNGNAVWGDGGIDNLNWFDDPGLGTPSTVLPGAGDDIIIMDPALIIDVPVTFNSLTISAPGELIIVSSLTITTNLVDNNTLSGSSGGSLSVGGTFTGSGDADLTGVTYSGPMPTITTLTGYPPVTVPVPVAPWAIITGFALIGGFTFYRIRRKVRA